MTTVPGPADSSLNVPDNFSGNATDSRTGGSKKTGQTEKNIAKSGRESNQTDSTKIRIRSLPKRVRIKSRPKKAPDSQLQLFLRQMPTTESLEVLTLLRQQAAGHWRDLSIEEQCVDAELLNSQIQSLSNESEHTVTEETNWNWRRDWLGLLISLLLHFAVLTLLVIWVQPEDTGDGPITLEGKIDQGINLAPLAADLVLAADSTALETTAKINQNIPIPFQPVIAQQAVRPQNVATTSLPSSSLPVAMSATGGGIAGRHPDKRAELLGKLGGNPASEAAVDRGLRWIQRHQSGDGGWSFRHGDCDCKDPGSCQTRTAATGLALLTFLARNHNHLDSSDYQQTVLDGLNFLITVADKGDLTENTKYSMYGQGIATLALAEAYAITKDPDLQKPAQQAVDFIVEAQHNLGGWRYHPHEMGDLNVTGWQLMALKTAKLAGLNVPDETLQKAKSFVDSQAISNGSQFVYPGLDPDTGQPVPTAIGILLRMYEGWGPNRDEIREGVRYLSGLNVSADHIYFNYYTTMVMFHYGGEQWRAWNWRMRDFLINTQDSGGHQDGSWFFPHAKTGNEGGRLFNTAMSVLILEVYYRHLRLYDEDAFTRDFPLE